MAERTERIIIVHSHEHVAAALEAASGLNLPVTLQSTPDAIFYAGGLYLQQMFTQAKAAFPQVDAIFILDCSHAGAEALSAMDCGHTHLRSSAPPELLAKIKDIAGQRGVTMVSGAQQSLDLRTAFDPRGACRKWLSNP